MTVRHYLVSFCVIQRPHANLCRTLALLCRIIHRDLRSSESHRNFLNSVIHDFLWVYSFLVVVKPLTKLPCKISSQIFRNFDDVKSSFFTIGHFQFQTRTLFSLSRVSLTCFRYEAATASQKAGSIRTQGRTRKVYNMYLDV